MTGIFSIFFFALGAVLASFVLVVSERLHTGDDWHRGRSRCNSCARELDARDLVPLFSWLLSLGRCRVCGSRIPAVYAFAEALLGTLFAASYLMVGIVPALLPLFFALAALLGLVAYDLRHMIIPYAFSVPFVGASFLYAVLATPSGEALGATLMTAGGIALAFFLMHIASRGRAMGLGDAPLALGLSLLAGPFALSGLLYSFWAGGVVGIILLSLGHGRTRMNSEVPFAPFLAFGFLLALFTSWDILFLLGLR